MKIRSHLPATVFASQPGDRVELEPGKVLTIAPDSPLLFDGHRIGTILGAVVDPLGEGVEVTAEISGTYAELLGKGFPYPLAPLSPEELLAEIVETAPEVPGMPPGGWIVYSARCCWWTNDVRDSVHAGHGAPIPLCPSCGSPLFQAPAADYVAQSVARPDHFGPHGIGALVAAFRATPCHPTWTEYEVPTTTTPEV